MLRCIRRCSNELARVTCRVGQYRCVSTENTLYPAVVKSQDGSMFVCWHPEKPFPYEYSKGESVLKAQYTMEEKNKYRPDGPTQQELMKIFHTTRHAFDRKPGLRYAKKNPPKDRKGI